MLLEISPPKIAGVVIFCIILFGINSDKILIATRLNNSETNIIIIMGSAIILRKAPKISNPCAIEPIKDNKTIDANKIE